MRSVRDDRPVTQQDLPIRHEKNRGGYEKYINARRSRWRPLDVTVWKSSSNAVADDCARARRGTWFRCGVVHVLRREIVPVIAESKALVRSVRPITPSELDSPDCSHREPRRSPWEHLTSVRMVASDQRGITTCPDLIPPMANAIKRSLRRRGGHPAATAQEYSERRRPPRSPMRGRDHPETRNPVEHCMGTVGTTARQYGHRATSQVSGSDSRDHAKSSPALPRIIHRSRGRVSLALDGLARSTALAKQPRGVARGGFVGSTDR